MTGRSIELHDLRVFLAVAEELHFGRASERLTLTPSRVSQTVRILEQRVGGLLFERTSRSVRLTPLGEQFLARVRRPYDELERVLSTSAPPLPTTLRLGFTASTEGPVLSDLVAAFTQRHPECQVSLHEVEMFDPFAGLRRGQVDVVVNWAVADDDDLTVGPTFAYFDRVLAVTRAHRLADRPTVSVEDLGDEEVVLLPATMPASIYDALAPPFTPSGRPIRRTLRARTLHETLSAVARGRIVHATAALSVVRRDDLVLIPIRDMPPLPMGLIWCAANPSPAVRAIADLAALMSPSASPTPTRSHTPV